jgi:hypothetical protein
MSMNLGRTIALFVVCFGAFACGIVEEGVDTNESLAGKELEFAQKNGGFVLQK